MSQETPMSVIDTCNEGAGEINSCAEPIPTKEIPSGNGSVVVSISNEGAGKVGSQAEPIRSGEDITQNEPELIADVFQDDILPRFMDAQSFKRFATAGNGLRLCRYDVQTIEDDHRHRSVENKKLEYLYKWREMFIGTDADAIKKIKELATTHLGSRNR